MKDIHAAKDKQPLSITSAAGVWAGSVHLIYSKDRKLGRKGGARTRQFLKVDLLHPHRKWVLLLWWGCGGMSSTSLCAFWCWPVYYWHCRGFRWVEISWRMGLHTINNLSRTDSLSSSQTMPTDWTGLEGFCQANWGAWQRSKVTPRESACHINTAPESQA